MVNSPVIKATSNEETTGVSRATDCKSAPRVFLARFLRDDSGSMVFFGIIIVLLILLVGGIGVDIMHAEMRRTKLQDTLDRAVLAAASLNQDLPAQTVLEDYMAKANLADHLQDVTIDEGIGYKSVTATASTTMATQFMNMAGVDSLSLYAASGAEERIGGVEISLVLDVSGSMNSNERLRNLKTAAKDFIDTMTNTTEAGKLSISIVPYATQVSVPEDLLAQFNVTAEQTYSGCVNFDSADFRSVGLSSSKQYQRTMHFDPWYTMDWRADDPKNALPYTVCPKSSEASRQIQILQNDATALKNYVDSLWAWGNTSIDLGMKWGTALLDPSLQPAVQTLANAGQIPSDFTDRPYAHDSGQTLKIIVLMTDGSNTSQYYIDEGFRSGTSDVWWNDEAEVYSVYVGQDTDDRDNDGNRSEDSFYWPAEDVWRDHAYGEGASEQRTRVRECRRRSRYSGRCLRYGWVWQTSTVEEPGSAQALSYAELWAYTSVAENAAQNFEPWMGYSAARSQWRYGVYSSHGRTEKDRRTKDSCDAAKSAGIVVFSIGFEAPSSGQAVLSDCASSAGHYFDVEGLEISDAFAAIASSIRQLRLVQ